MLETELESFDRLTCKEDKGNSVTQKEGRRVVRRLTWLMRALDALSLSSP